MTPLPPFDALFADGLAIINPADHVALYLGSPAIAAENPVYAKLIRAERDLARLRQGWRPTPDDLSNAPCLSHWSFAATITGDVTVLFGIVNGHPRIRDGGWCTTSMLVAIDTCHWKWARTLSRFYRIKAGPVVRG